jgi:methyl-CpG-binding domain protein 4
MTWKPPKSPYELLQEEYWSDPWKVLVVCVFCNLTKRVKAEPFIREYFRRYDNPKAASEASIDAVEELIRPLGLSRKRSLVLQRMSAEFLEKDWSEPKELYGLGKYANDAWLIFCAGRWEDVEPKDYALNFYHAWLKDFMSGEPVGA